MNKTSKKNDIRIYGAGGHSQVIRSVLEENGYTITEVFDDKPSGKHHASKNVVPGAKDKIDSFERNGPPVIIAIGNNKERAEIAELLHCSYSKAIHHSAIISKSAKVGKGTVVFAGAIIQPNTYIGEHVIINTGASVDHDNVIGDFAHISPKAALCGHVEVGEGSHVGVGALVIPKVKIGKWCTIGAGTVVLKDVPDYSTVVGNPGKVIKTVAPKNRNEKAADILYDIIFVGSGISSSFTIINFLDNIKGKITKGSPPIRIALLEKYPEFHTGIPYGERSGSSSLLITSLSDFLPEPEFSKFTTWLSDNKMWLIDEFEKDGGELSRQWLDLHQKSIEENDWGDLFIPRRFFGHYVHEKITSKIEEARITGQVIVESIVMTVENIIKKNGLYRVIENEKVLLAKKIVLAIGSPPPKAVWNTSLEKLSQKDEGLLLFSNPYKPSLKETLGRVETFLRKRKGLETNILIIGANASALEILFKLNDYGHLAEAINKFAFISTLGMIPDSIVDTELGKKFQPKNLIRLKKEDELTAEQIADAAFADLDAAESISLGAATTVKPISQAFGALLGVLKGKELEKFACFVGNEIGRRQRCAGIQYSKVTTDLAKKGRFEHLAGRFTGIGLYDGEYKVSYLDTPTKKNKVHADPMHIVFNCIGSETLDHAEKISPLYANLAASNLCVPNDSLRGFRVDHKLRANDNLYIIGPLLAGNVIDGKAIWHVEHCGRILWLSKFLADKLAKNIISSLSYKNQVSKARKTLSYSGSKSLKDAKSKKNAKGTNKLQKELFSCEVVSGKKEWDSFLNEIGHFDFYHTFDYHNVSKNESETPILLKYEETNHRIGLPLLLRKIENTNYMDATSVYGYPGPIASGDFTNFDNTNFIRAMMAYFKERRIISVFSRLHPYLPYQNTILKDCGSIVKQGRVVNIDLTLNPDAQRKNYQSRLRTYINKARKHCPVRKASSTEDLQAFVEIYHENMRRVNAKQSYFFGMEYFQKLVEGNEFDTEILLAVCNESKRIIAGAVFVVTNDIVQYHLAGSRDEFLHLNPTKLLIDEMRLIANKRACKIMNLGGGLNGHDFDSLFRFKAMFSKDYRMFNLWRLIADPEAYNQLSNNKKVGKESNFFPLYRFNE